MNKYFLRKESGSIFLCCGKAGCPSVTQSDDGSMVIIKDDDGNQVKMKIEEARKRRRKCDSLPNVHTF